MCWYQAAIPRLPHHGARKSVAMLRIRKGKVRFVGNVGNDRAERGASCAMFVSVDDHAREDRDDKEGLEWARFLFCSTGIY